MFKNRNKSWLKIILATSLFIFLYLPLKADKIEAELNLSANDGSRIENKTRFFHLLTTLEKPKWTTGQKASPVHRSKVKFRSVNRTTS